MASFPDPRTIRSTRRSTPRRVLAAAAVAVVAVTLGCGGTDDAGTGPTTGDPVATVTRTTTVTATVTAAPTTVTVTADPGTTGTNVGARPTVADLERELAARIEREFPRTGPGEARCEAEGTLSDWQPVLCHFLPDDPAEFPGIHVSMLDGGRYGWGLGECCGGSPWADHYPSGMYCRDLRQPPPDSWGGPDYHLNYGQVVYYWLTEGRPDRMDADHDGVPCETVYPADEVTPFWDSVRVLDAAG
jgi:hypothetical protein